MTVSAPTASVVVEQVATPLTNAAAPQFGIVTPATENATVPVAWSGVTVAVRVTDVPLSADVGAAVNAVVVLSAWTSTVGLVVKATGATSLGDSVTMKLDEPAVVGAVTGTDEVP